MMSDPPLSYLEASAVLAYLNNEPGRAEHLEALFEEVVRGNVRLVTSTTTLAEVAFLKETGTTLDTDVDTRIDSLLLDRRIVTLVECTEDIARGARRYVRPAAGQAQRLKPADAIHLSSAIAAGVDYFLTYDSDFDPTVLDVDFEIIEPRSTNPRLDLPDASI